VAGEPSLDFDHAVGTAAIVADRFAETIAWSIDMTEMAHATTGRSTWLMRDDATLSRSCRRSVDV
jgi:hypothetical protein